MTSTLQIEITALNNASAEVQKLTGDLKGVTGATQEHTKAADENNKTMDSAKEGFGSVIQSVTGLSLGMLSAGGAIVGLYEGMKASIDAAENLGEATEKLSKLTGGTAEQTSKLIGVAQIFGLTTDDLSRALMAAVRKGYEPTIQGLQQMRAEYQSIQDPVAQSKYLMDTFGRSGTQLAEFLAADNATLEAYGAHVQAAGLIMDESGVQKTEEYGRQVQMLNQNFEGLKVNIGMGVIPTLTNWIDVINRTTDAQKKQNLGLLDYLPIAAQVREIQRLQNAEFDRAAVATGNATKETGFLKVMMEDEARATAANTTATMSAKEQKAALKNAASDLSFEMGKLTTATLYHEAAQGLDSEAAFKLAEKMGLVDTKSKEAHDALVPLKEQFDKGQLSADQYAAAVKNINDILLDVPIDAAKARKALDDLTKQQFHIQVISDFSGIGQGFGGSEDKGSGKSGYGGGGSSSSGGGREGSHGRQQAVGGWGGGWTMVGEAGPEMVNLPAGSYVQNNYDMRTSYNLQAHYPQYQSPTAARDDLIGLTMLRNTGAARWAH